MRLFLTLSLIVVLTVHAYADRRGGKAVIVDQHAMQADLTAMLADLDAIDRLNAASTDRATRKKIDKKIDRLRASLEDLADELDDARVSRDDDRRDGDRRDHRDRRAIAMTDGDFAQLLVELDAATMSSDKRGLVLDVARTGWFTSDQVAAIVDHLTHSDDQLEAAVALHPRVTDPSNFHRVYKHLAHSSDRDALRERIGAR